MKTLRTLLATAIGGLALVVCAAAPRAEILEQILVKVNGEIFTKTELEARQIAALRQMGQTERNTNLSDAQLRQMLNEATPQLIVSVVDEIIIVQRGHELGYRMGDEQFKSILDNIKKDNKIESDEQFQAALKEENMTLDDLRKSLERQMIVSRVQQNEVLGKVSVSEDESRRYYETHQNEFTSQQTVTLREVLVSSDAAAGATVASDGVAREKAADIRRRALAGESFEKLAADLSDSPSRANAGLIGPLDLSDLSPELRTLLESMKPGDVTDILRTPRGYQVLKLETKSAPETAAFDKAREDIGNKLFTLKRQEEFQKYIEKLRSEAIIEWKNADLKRAYDQGVQQAKAATTKAAAADAPRP